MDGIGGTGWQREQGRPTLNSVTAGHGWRGVDCCGGWMDGLEAIRRYVGGIKAKPRTGKRRRAKTDLGVSRCVCGLGALLLVVGVVVLSVCSRLRCPGELRWQLRNSATAISFHWRGAVIASGRWSRGPGQMPMDYRLHSFIPTIQPRRGGSQKGFTFLLLASVFSRALAGGCG